MTPTNRSTLKAVRLASNAWQIASERDGWKAGEYYFARLQDAKKARKDYLAKK